jgi:thiamine-phosphate pyrophosphorylase
VANKLARARLARAAAHFHRNPQLPPLVFLMDDERVTEPLASVVALPRGTLVIVRARDAVRRRALAEATSAIARRRGLHWIVAGDPELAAQTGADGAHFPEAALGEALHWRAKRPRWLITCAAHSLHACARAARADADAVLLGPVFATKSHVGRLILGPMRFSQMARQSPITVYALGGIDETTARRLKKARLAGLAAIGALMA